jgi:hypothetical protein
MEKAVLPKRIETSFELQQQEKLRPREGSMAGTLSCRDDPSLLISATTISRRSDDSPDGLGLAHATPRPHHPFVNVELRRIGMVQSQRLEA